MRGKPIEFKVEPDGCIVPTSHKLNKDGYFRTRDYRVTKAGRKPLIMYHRLVWEEHKGEIPDGFEVDHKCRNRACCNIDHLQMLSGREHAVKTNSERYSDRKEAARVYWEINKCSGAFLAKEFGVSFSSACRWIKGWKV